MIIGNVVSLSLFCHWNLCNFLRLKSRIRKLFSFSDESQIFCTISVQFLRLKSFSDDNRQSCFTLCLVTEICAIFWEWIEKSFLASLMIICKFFCFRRILAQFLPNFWDWKASLMIIGKVVSLSESAILSVWPRSTCRSHIWLL